MIDNSHLIKELKEIRGQLMTLWNDPPLTSSHVPVRLSEPLCKLEKVIQELEIKELE